MKLALDLNTFSSLLENDEFLYRITRSLAIPWDSDFSYNLKLSDFIGTHFDREISEGLKLSQAVDLFFQGLIPDYSFDHPINQNLGAVVRKSGKVSFYGAAIYSDSEGELYLSVGGTDKKKGIEPFKVPLIWQEKAKAYSIPGAQFVSLTEIQGEVDLGSEKSIKTVHLVGKFFVKEEVFYDEIWVSLAKKDKDYSKAEVSSAFIKAWNKKGSNFEGIVGKQGSGLSNIAKCNGIFQRYFEAGLLKAYAFPVVGISLEKREKKDGGTFEVLNLIPDFSGYPEIPVQVLDFKEGSTGSRQVPITELSVIQFSKSSGNKESRKPSKYYQKLLDAQAGLIPLPSIDNPWYLEFRDPPKKPNSTPAFSFWAGFVPPPVKALVEKCKSVGYINPAKISELQEAVEVEVTRSEFIPAELSVEDITDDDF